MAATVQIRRWTGTVGAPVQTQIDSSTSRMSVSDDPNPGVTNPIPVPPSGIYYSYWLSSRLYVSVTPTGTIDNLKWFTDAANTFGTGVTCAVATATSYVEATGTLGTTGDELTTGNHAGIGANPLGAFGYTTGAPLSVTGSLTNPSTGDLGDWVVYQVGLAPTTPPGDSGVETFTFRYDET